MRNERVNRIMTPNPVSIRADDTLQQVIDIFESREIHHLPVVMGGALVGIISSNDVMTKIGESGKTKRISHLLAAEIMKKDPLCITERASLREAARLLCTGDIHSLPVVDHRQMLVGIITSTDLIHHMLLRIPQGDGSIKPEPVNALQERVHVLEEIRMATEMYLRTGHGEHEHAVLLEKLAGIQNTVVNI